MHGRHGIGRTEDAPRFYWIGRDSRYLYDMETSIQAENNESRSRHQPRTSVQRVTVILQHTREAKTRRREGETRRKAAVYTGVLDAGAGEYEIRNMRAETRTDGLWDEEILCVHKHVCERRL